VALGVAALGARSGTDDPVGIGLLEEARSRPATAAQRSRVLAALATALRHGRVGELDPRAAAAADEAVELDRASDAARALADALHARHDVLSAPGAGAAPTGAFCAGACRGGARGSLIGQGQEAPSPGGLPDPAAGRIRGLGGMSGRLVSAGGLPGAPAQL
jgi:hypothetical protein